MDKPHSLCLHCGKRVELGLYREWCTAKGKYFCKSNPSTSNPGHVVPYGAALISQWEEEAKRERQAVIGTTAG